ncbi:MAG: MarR family transcriptional regulator [Dehalococcoidia bacterium]
MSDDGAERVELLQALGRTMRVFSSQTVLYTQAMADRLGLNLTDLLCSGILAVVGPVTAGRLAEMTGLTTGAITGVVDRLEALGYARREADRTDRRRVIIQIVPERVAGEVSSHFAPMLASMAELSAEYSGQSLSLILKYMNDAAVVLREETARLRRETAAQRAHG